jgi:ubiquinone/menaquinone biosynthesis C-methylase UbiE
MKRGWRNAMYGLLRIVAQYIRIPYPLNRDFLVSLYVSGTGIEIGALHNPVKLPPNAKAKYVDRMVTAELRKQYPELSKKELVEVDVVDDGESLEKFSDASQDFVIANHFLEHCQNPIGAISNMLRVLKSGGVLFLSLPDKRYCFDVDRPITSLDHIVKDYELGADWSRESHYTEWVTYLGKAQGPEEIQLQINNLMNINYSIHYHVWTQTEMMEILVFMQSILNNDFEVEFIYKNAAEVILILRK